jgi:hypothetical protein
LKVNALFGSTDVQGHQTKTKIIPSIDCWISEQGFFFLVLLTKSVAAFSCAVSTVAHLLTYAVTLIAS